MNATNYKAISLEPYLCKEGDVVSAEVWNSVLGLFVNRLNSVGDYFKQYDDAFSTISDTLTAHSAALIDVNASLAQTKQTWDTWVNRHQEKLDALDNMWSTYRNIEQVQESLENGLVHYGETAPNNEHVRIWVAPIMPASQLFNDGDELTVTDGGDYTAIAEIKTLTLLYPNIPFICSLFFTTAPETEGAITINFPTGTKFIGTKPTFGNGETWELNIKNGVVVGGKVV